MCHSPCYLTDVPKEVIGSPLLINCSAMNSNKICNVCGHSYLVHMHIYFITETYPGEIIDHNTEKNIKLKEDIKAELEKTIGEVETRSNKYKEEKKIIQESMAKFAHFLKNNAITAYNDNYEEYIQYLISK